MLRFRLIIGVFIAIFMVVVGSVQGGNSFQERITSTPAQINLPDTAPQAATIQLVVSPTVTRTPTPVGLAILEAKTEANVRAQPSIDAELLGTIRNGEIYTVLGRYFRWIQFQFNPNLNQGIGWVFDDLVTISGDQSTIRVLTDEDLSGPVDNSEREATETAIAITLTPGGLLTSTANARILSLPDSSQTSGGAPNPDANEGPLPTFTFPANVVAIAPTSGIEVATTTEANTAETITNVVTSEGIPPIVPILVFGGLGILGLLITAVRRQ